VLDLQPSFIHFSLSPSVCVHLSRPNIVSCIVIPVSKCLQHQLSGHTWASQLYPLPLFVSLSLSHTHKHSLSLSLSHNSNTHTLTLSLCLFLTSLNLTLSPFFSCYAKSLFRSVLLPLPQPGNTN